MTPGAGKVAMSAHTYSTQTRKDRSKRGKQKDILGEEEAGSPDFDRKPLKEKQTSGTSYRNDKKNVVHCY